MSEMSKNDMAQVEHLLAGSPDPICGKCKKRINLNRGEVTWSTCTPVDKMYTCSFCTARGKEKRVAKGACSICWSSNPLPGKTMCNYCYEREFVPSIMEHPDVRGKYDHSIIKSDSTYKRLRKYRNRYLYMEFVNDKPGVTARYVGPIIDRTICHYCKQKDDGRHSPVFLLHRSGTRYRFCNLYREDYEQCYEKWLDEFDMHCSAEYEDVKCHVPKPHPGGWEFHEFIIDNRFYRADHEMKNVWDLYKHD